MSKDEAALHLADLQSWVDSRVESEDIRQQSSAEDIKKRYPKEVFDPNEPAAPQSLRRKKLDKGSVTKALLIELWNDWYLAMSKAGYKTAKPYLIPNESKRHLRDIVLEFGPEKTKEILRLAAADWAALQSKRKGIPDVPNLRYVAYHRQELADAAAQGGLVSGSQRVSNYKSETEEPKKGWFGSGGC